MNSIAPIYVMASNSFITVFEQMPDSLREMLKVKVANNYLKASKRKVTIRGVRMDAPKRSLDLILRYLLSPEEIIDNELSSCKTIAEAYEVYLQKNANIFGEEQVSQDSAEILTD